MTNARTYPAGVPSWVDVEHRDVEAAKRFYGELLGWTFTRATPPGVAFQYVAAQLDGQDVAGIAGPAYAMDDETAIKVVDGTVEVVSEGRWVLLRS